MRKRIQTTPSSRGERFDCSIGICHSFYSILSTIKILFFLVCECYILSVCRKQDTGWRGSTGSVTPNRTWKRKPRSVDCQKNSLETHLSNSINHNPTKMVSMSKTPVRISVITTEDPACEAMGIPLRAISRSSCTFASDTLWEGTSSAKHKLPEKHIRRRLQRPYDDRTTPERRRIVRLERVPERPREMGFRGRREESQ